jgi:hypothetical protein
MIPPTGAALDTRLHVATATRKRHLPTTLPTAPYAENRGHPQRQLCIWSCIEGVGREGAGRVSGGTESGENVRPARKSVE